MNNSINDTEEISDFRGEEMFNIRASIARKELKAEEAKQQFDELDKNGLINHRKFVMSYYSDGICRSLAICEEEIEKKLQDFDKHIMDKRWFKELSKHFIKNKVKEQMFL